MKRPEELGDPHAAAAASDPLAEATSGFDRRAFLLRAAAAGAITWSTPVVTGVGVARAYASPAPTSCWDIAPSSTPREERPSFDRERAVAYSDAWAHGRNSRYRSFENDCTNFQSQAWHEGGSLPMRDLAPPYWYNRNGAPPTCTPPTISPAVDRYWGYSHSWAVVADFESLWVNELGWATLLTADLASSSNPGLKGDAIQYDFGRGEGWSHGSIEAGWGDFTYTEQIAFLHPSTSYTGDYMNQHGTDRYHAPWNWCWLNEKDAVIRSQMRARIIHWSDS